jgi:hypothetical protein
MSLFEAREWWSAENDHQDDELRFGRRALCTGNVDNQVPGSEKIVVGSLAGQIRVYAPTQRNYRIEDLVLEKDLGKPILQISAGRFFS